MKDFLKFTLATVTGLVLAGGIFFVLSFILLIGIVAASSSKEVVQVKPNSILTIKLNKPIEERSIEDPFAMLMGEEYSNMGLNEILSSIKQAKENINIRGIYLEAGYYMDIPVAFLEEVRRALLDFKESGKFVVAYGDNYTQKEYYLCSVADKVMLNPQGSIEWTGLSESPIFFKRLLDKAGVEVQIFKVGTYKSAVEPFISTQMSEASREQTSVYLNSIWNRMNEDVAVSRDLTVKQLNEYADQMIAMEAAQTFIDAKLADTLSYKDGVKIYLKQLTDTALDKPLQTLGITEMTNVVQTKMPITKGNNTIAVYYATGDITDNTMAAIPGETGGIDGNTVVKDLSRLREDANVKAVVLRVNSPGGSAFASEQIWNEVVKLKAEKPVIVSMGSMAASGGYYISCAADSIFAEATTLTGSIGIFGMVPNFEGLLTDKIGLDIDVVKTNPHSDMNFPIRPMSEREKNIIQKNVERGYALFVKRCADGRGMSEDAIRQVAEGRVWTGATAKELGLVDQLGGINEALKAASEKAGLEHYTVADYPEETDPFTALLQKGKDEYINARLRKNTGEFYHYLHVIQRLKQASPIQAHMGFYPNI
ncbi:MAG: signal peptide peptidase SppA [Bacteroidaceae bacterium]|nr:signal peptide peptidase SppA [Bacteroidaceae bacterium]